jgi:hypothetical protein
MRNSKSRLGRMAWSFLLSAAACLASGTALATCTPGAGVSCYIVVQPIDVCTPATDTTPSSCAPFNTTSTTGVGSPTTACDPTGTNPLNCGNPIGFVVNPSTGAANPTSGGVDVTRTLLNTIGIDLTWNRMQQYTSTALQTLSVTQGWTCIGSIAGTTLTIASCSSGIVSVSDSLSGTNITSGTTITALGTGSGGAGTYTVDRSSSAASTTITGTSTIFQSQDFRTLSDQPAIAQGSAPSPAPPLSSDPTFINLFFINTLNPPSQQAGGTLYGFSWIGNNGVAIARNTFGYPRCKTCLAPRPDTIAHELLHNLGLDHPFFGAGPYNPFNAQTNPKGGVVPVLPANPLALECDPNYPACSRNLMTTGSLRTEPTVACVLAPALSTEVTPPAACLTTVSGLTVQLPGLYTGTADQVTTPSSASSTLLPVSQQTQVLGNGTTQVPPGSGLVHTLTSGFLNPIPHETTKAQLGTGGSSTHPIVFDVSGPTDGKPGETLVAWLLTLPQEQTFARHGRFHIISQSRQDLVQDVDYYPDAGNNRLMRNIAYYPGADNNPDNLGIGTAVPSPCTAAEVECLMVKFQAPGLGAHDSISFSKSILSGGAPITNDDLCKAKITYIFSDGYATTSNLGPCPAVSLPLIASSWTPDPTVSPRIVKPGVLLAQTPTHPPPCTPDSMGNCPPLSLADANPSEEGGANLQSCTNGAAPGSNDVSGKIQGDVTVTSGQCNFKSPCELKGNLTINGGGVFLDCTVDGNVTENSGVLTFGPSANVFGNVLVSGASSFNLGQANPMNPTALIGGNLVVQTLASASQQNTVCGTEVKGYLLVQNNNGGSKIEIGGSSSCRNSVRGNLQIIGNLAPTDVSFNTVAGNLQCQNDPNLTLASNTVNGQTQCTP